MSASVTHKSSKKTSLRWWGPTMLAIGRTSIAGSDIGTRKIVKPCCFLSPRDVRVRRKHHCAIVA